MDYRSTIEKARSIHGRYPLQARNVFRFILEGFCLPLEVFFHGRMGLRYFHIPKAFLGLVFLFLCLMLVNFGVSFHVSVYLLNMGFVRAYPIIHLPESWAQFWGDFRTAYTSFTDLLQNSETSESSDVVQAAIFLYIAFVNFRWLEQIWRERSGEITHPRSSGEPYRLWNPVYWLGQKLNFQSDIVKQFCEPLLCLGLSQLALSLKNYSGLEKREIQGLEFVAVWLGFGGMLLMLKAFIENRTRSQAEYDRRANDLDSEGFEAAGDEELEEREISVTFQPRV